MDPTLDATSNHLPLIPEQVQGNTLSIKGINCKPIAFRILSETHETPSPLQTHEIATMAIIEGRPQKIALSIQELSSELGLTLEEIKNAVEKRKGFDVERLKNKSKRRQERMQETNLSTETLFEIKKIAKRIIALSPSSPTTTLVELPAKILGERDVQLLVSDTPDTKPKILVQIGRLGSGGIGEVTKWLDLKTLDRAALKIPHDAQQAEQRKEVQREAHLLMDIARDLGAQALPSVGIQLPPHRLSEIQQMSQHNDSLVPTSKTLGFLGHVYSGDLFKNYDTLNPTQKIQAASELTMGLDLLHTYLDRPHGDIKLENIFFDNEHFYLADIGDGKTCKQKEEILTASSQTGLTYDVVDKINGMFTFLHPQDISFLIRFAQSRNIPSFQEVKKAADIYSLGIALLCLFNSSIAVSLTPLDKSSQILYDSLTQISQQQNPFETNGLSRSQEHLILRMIDPDWTKRPSAENVSMAFPIPIA